MSKDVFSFQQFTVHQDRCAMKVNTDGFLLGVMSDVSHQPQTVLEIGTGTGFVSLMLAQRTGAKVDAVEIDLPAAEQAAQNFQDSPWAAQMQVHACAFEDFSTKESYDLVISNPPYFVHSYTSPDKRRDVARRAGEHLFDTWFEKVAGMLAPRGSFYLIIPFSELEAVDEAASKAELYLREQVYIHSFDGHLPKRLILGYSLENKEVATRHFSIFEEPGTYSAEYKSLAKGFFLNF